MADEEVKIITTPEGIAGMLKYIFGLGVLPQSSIGVAVPSRSISDQDASDVLTVQDVPNIVKKVVEEMNSQSANFTSLDEETMREIVKKAVSGVKSHTTSKTKEINKAIESLKSDIENGRIDTKNFVEDLVEATKKEIIETLSTKLKEDVLSIIINNSVQPTAGGQQTPINTTPKVPRILFAINTNNVVLLIPASTKLTV